MSDKTTNKWDISQLKAYKAEDYPKGARIPEAGTSKEYVTGGWRSQRPVRDESKCTHCLMCWIFCADAAVKVQEGKVTDFDLAHCKGCGVCAEECPVKAITMSPEGCEIGEERK